MSAQSMEALSKANRHRLARACLRRALKAGKEDAAQVILFPADYLLSMPVVEVLVAQRGWGLARAHRLLRSAHVGEARTLGALTDRQRSAVAALLGGA